MEALFGISWWDIAILVGLIILVLLFVSWVERSKRRAEERRNRRG